MRRLGAQAEWTVEYDRALIRCQEKMQRECSAFEGARNNHRSYRNAESRVAFLYRSGVSHIHPFRSTFRVPSGSLAAPPQGNQFSCSGESPGVQSSRFPANTLNPAYDGRGKGGVCWEMIIINPSHEFPRPRRQLIRAGDAAL